MSLSQLKMECVTYDVGCDMPNDQHVQLNTCEARSRVLVLAGVQTNKGKARCNSLPVFKNHKEAKEGFSFYSGEEEENTATLNDTDSCDELTLQLHTQTTLYCAFGLRRLHNSFFQILRVKIAIT